MKVPYTCGAFEANFLRESVPLAIADLCCGEFAVTREMIARLLLKGKKDLGDRAFQGLFARRLRFTIVFYAGSE